MYLWTMKYILTRFILTMWYVNDKLTTNYFAHKHGFILTMWYVNYNLSKNDKSSN